MPRISRWFVKASLLYLMLAMLADLAVRAGWFDLNWGLVRPAQLHMITLGWLTQLIYGIGYWLLPIHPLRRDRGPVWLIWAVFVMHNVSMILRVASEPWVPLGHSCANIGLLVGGLGLWCASILWVVNLWPRIR